MPAACPPTPVRPLQGNGPRTPPRTLRRRPGPHLHARDCEEGDVELDLDGRHLALGVVLGLHAGQAKVAAQPVLLAAREALDRPHQGALLGHVRGRALQGRGGGGRGRRLRVGVRARLATNCAHSAKCCASARTARRQPLGKVLRVCVGGGKGCEGQPAGRHQVQVAHGRVVGRGCVRPARCGLPLPGPAARHPLTAHCAPPPTRSLQTPPFTPRVPYSPPPTHTPHPTHPRVPAPPPTCAHLLDGEMASAGMGMWISTLLALLRSLNCARRVGNGASSREACKGGSMLRKGTGQARARHGVGAGLGQGIDAPPACGHKPGRLLSHEPWPAGGMPT